MRKTTFFKTMLLAVMILAGNTNTSAQIISQYVETNSGTTPKGIEIWNNTSSTLDFSINNLIIQQGTNGGALTDISATTINTGTLATGAVLVIGTEDIGTYLTGQGLTSVNFTTYAFPFNGDDALSVKYGGVVTDIFGTPGIDPGSSWTENGVSTANQNIKLNDGITSGSASAWTDPSLRFNTVSSTPATLPSGLSGFGVAPSTSSCTTSSLAFVSSPIVKLTTDAKFTITPTTNSTGTISYLSSVETVATVDPLTGEVTIVGAGATEITANQTSDATYCANTVKYTLNVSAAAPTITVTEVTVPALSAQIGNSDTEIINVSGANLTADIILTIDGANADMFSVNSPLPSSGGIATITYTPTANGLHTATLRLNSVGAAEETRTLNGSSILPAVSGAVIISEVYGGGGNSGATLVNDFIELYNPTAEQVEIGGWSIQYYSAAATGLASNIYEIPAGKYIPSGAHFLIKAAAGTGGTLGLLQPDAQSTLTLGSAAGKIILYNTNVAQTISDLASITGNPNFVDYVPYGTSAVPVWGTAMSSNLTNTTSATRNSIPPAAIGGQRVIAAVNYMYTGDINNDFSVAAPSPTSTGLNTGFNTAKMDANVYAENGKVVFQASANQTVEIFNAVGQRIVIKNAVDGLNTIPVTQKGLLIVKVGNKVSKVIL